MSGSFKVVIPARYASTRLPGKPLADIGGLPMIARVVERAVASGAAQVVVASDDERVLEAVRDQPCEARITRSDHVSGSDRVMEVAAACGWPMDAVVVNVQGDEPLIPSAIIRQVAALLADSPGSEMASLYHRIHEIRDVFDPNVVKVVCDAAGRALYFSRAPIPYDRATFEPAAGRGEARGHLRHIGLYAYRAGFLRRYVTLDPAPAERSEALEQLRALHHGATVVMAEACESPGPGVDTPADLERVRALMGTPGA